MSQKLNPVFQTETAEEDKGMYLREGTDYYDLNGIENKNTQMMHDELATLKTWIQSNTTSSNQLVNKKFVNSSIQTNTAFYRGSWTTWAAVPTDPSQYRSDTQSSTTPTSNDYIVVEDASGYTVRSLEGTWRFKYTGTWANNGKNGWEPEYRVNEKPFTTAQQESIDSGSTSKKISTYDAHVNSNSNPHNVTKSQVGLDKVDNTSDASKPVSTAQQTELDKKVNISQGASNANMFMKTNASGQVICEPLAQGVNKIEIVNELPATTVPTTLYLIRETT